jgi:hypothetical protein
MGSEEEQTKAAHTGVRNHNLTSHLLLELLLLLRTASSPQATRRRTVSN